MTRRCCLPRQHTVPFHGNTLFPSTDKTVAVGGNHTEGEQKERSPPSGESRTRARGEEAFSNGEVDRKQGVLLLPSRGGGDRKARLAVIKSYNPLPALIERAAELGVNALAEDMLGKWRRNRIANNRLPLDFEAAEADFENWIRDEPRFANRDAERSVGRRRNGSLIQTAINEARNTNGC
jgi:hypothetical protein